MKLIKPLIPSLRERKRYLVFEYISKAVISPEDAGKTIMKAAREFLGDLGVAGAGLKIIKDKYKKNRGIVRVNHKFVDHVRASFCFVNEVAGNPVQLRSIGASGILKKAQIKYMEG